MSETPDAGGPTRDPAHMVFRVTGTLPRGDGQVVIRTNPVQLTRAWMRAATEELDEALHAALRAHIGQPRLTLLTADDRLLRKTELIEGAGGGYFAADDRRRAPIEKISAWLTRCAMDFGRRRTRFDPVEDYPPAAPVPARPVLQALLFDVTFIGLESDGDATWAIVLDEDAGTRFRIPAAGLGAKASVPGDDVIFSLELEAYSRPDPDGAYRIDEAGVRVVEIEPESPEGLLE